MEPRIIKKGKGPSLQSCSRCKIMKSADDFLDVNYWTYENGKYHICNSCLKEYFSSKNWSWQEMDKFCQSIDIPFIPSEFERLHDINGDNVLPIYIRMFVELGYEELEWKQYHDKYMELARKEKLDLELPSVRDSYYEDLRLRWGQSYDEEALIYLESLYNGMLSSMNISGSLQMDQAQKLCKISLDIDERITAGVDVDKPMASYERLAKIANFTPKNIRSDSDFSSFGEVVAWEEKRGWLNPHYDNVNRDIVDETLRSSQSFVQRLFTNETGLAEEIEERIQRLIIAAELDKEDMQLDQKRFEDDSFFNLDINQDLEQYENDAYQELIVEEVLDADTTGV